MQPTLLIIAQKGFQDIELNGTRDALLDAGFTVVLASTDIGMCTGKFGGKEEATVALSRVHVAHYDRIAFIGGPGAGELWKNEDAKRIAREAVELRIPLGAICIAPTVLAAAGVLEGKKATVWDDGEQTQGTFLREHGAEYVEAQVVSDGLILTGNGPEAAEEFGRELAIL